jgi:hypothetical protein
MDISDVSGDLESLVLPSNQKKAMLHLIDSKINTDMKEVIAEIRQLESKLTNEIKVIYWVIGIAMAIILFVVARK